MNENKWCKQLPSGQQKPSWLVNCIPNKKIPGPGLYIAPPTPPPPPPQLEARRYNMVERPSFISGSFCGYYDGYQSFTLSISSLVVNGVQYVTGGDLTTTLNSGNTNFVSANNNEFQYSPTNSCVTEVSGFTYTNFVDFLNTSFNSLSVPSLTAQTAYEGVDMGGQYPRTSGFYLIYTSSTEFNITMLSNRFGGGQSLSYSQSGITLVNLFDDYYKSTNTGITISNGVVIE